MTARPSISVVVPAYNLEGIIGRGLRSAIGQTDPPDEVIVVDDGSTDGTREEILEVAKQAPPGVVRMVSRPHAGPSAARNVGIDSSRSDWIAFLDGDDFWLPEKLAAVPDIIAGDHNVDIIAHDQDVLGLDGRSTYRPLHSRFDPEKPLLPQLYRHAFLATSCVTVRTKLLRDHGGFDPSLRGSQDFDLWLRLARHGRLVFIPRPLEGYVHRLGSISSNVRLRYRSTLRIFYRHAPYLVPLVGAWGAYRLRLRQIVFAPYVGFLQYRQGGKIADLLVVLFRAPFETVKALIWPLDAK